MLYAPYVVHCPTFSNNLTKEPSLTPPKARMLSKSSTLRAVMTLEHGARHLLSILKVTMPDTWDRRSLSIFKLETPSSQAKVPISAPYV